MYEGIVRSHDIDMLCIGRKLFKVEYFDGGVEGLFFKLVDTKSR